MNVIFLQSGSAGNSLYVESKGIAVLLDAGISAKKVKTRLAENGGDLSKVQAVILSHGHRDHSGCAGVYHRRLGLPIFAPRALAMDLEEWDGVPSLSFRPGEQIEVGSLVIETIPTPHDCPDAVAFVVSDGRRRLGVFTDLGHPFRGIDKILSTVDALIIESNYDPKMLAEGPYPPELQARIRGPGGHLSNFEAAELVKKLAGQLQWVCLAHLSQHNNTPETACRTFLRVVGRGSPIVAEYYFATRLPPLR